MNTSYLQYFLDESKDLLEQLDLCLSQAEGGSGSQSIGGVFRVLHNMKGSAHSVGLKDLGLWAHEAEDLVQLCRQKKLGLIAALVSALEAWSRVTKEWLLVLPDGRPGTQSVGQARAILQETAEKISRGEARELGAILLSMGATTKADLDQAGKTKDKKLGEILVETGVVSSEVINQALVVQKNQGRKVEETLRVPIKALDRILDILADLSVQNGIVRTAKERNQLEHHSVYEAVDFLHQGIEELIQESSKLRMMPFQSLYRRIEKLAQELALNTRKMIEIEPYGEELEIDRNILEKIRDPLMHLVRNAIDHGIELPEVRKAKAKKPTGRLKIEILEFPAAIQIRVRDDGQGLDEQKIHAKALAMGLVNPGKLLTRDEIYDLLFEPGFSTSANVSEISGRGVGMDVVKRAVLEMGGRIEIESKLDQGTEFTLILPVKIGSIESLIVSVNQIDFAVPLQDVIEVIDFSQALAAAPSVRASTIRYNNEDLPYYSLGQMLNAPQGSTQSAKVALITSYRQTKLAVLCDELKGREAIVMRPVWELFGNACYFQGSTILGNGEPSLILHLNAICEQHVGRQIHD